MKCIFEKKTVYGVERLYPVNETAEVLTMLTRKKTVDANDLELIKKLGIELGFNVSVYESTSIILGDPSSNPELHAAMEEAFR